MTDDLVTVSAAGSLVVVSGPVTSLVLNILVFSLDFGKIDSGSFISSVNSTQLDKFNYYVIHPFTAIRNPLNFFLFYNWF